MCTVDKTSFLRPGHIVNTSIFKLVFRLKLGDPYKVTRNYVCSYIEKIAYCNNYL